MNRNAFWLVLFGILALGLAVGPDLWAAPGQSPARQTVPTKTPPRPPTEPPPPPPTEPPPPPPTSPPPAPTSTVDTVPAEGPADPLLPKAGGESVYLSLGMALMVMGFLALVVARRRA
jgi:LPXTG-motif cell wall-anchored protein